MRLAFSETWTTRGLKFAPSASASLDCTDSFIGVQAISLDVHAFSLLKGECKPAQGKREPQATIPWGNTVTIHPAKPAVQPKPSHLPAGRPPTIAARATPRSKMPSAITPV